MLWSLGLLLGQFVVAYLALDAVFRYGNLEPSGLRERMARWGRWYGAGALIAALLTGWVQWRLDGGPGLALAIGNWIPWWLLWRFGLRKQLTFLFKDDGGAPLTKTKPDL